MKKGNRFLVFILIFTLIFISAWITITVLKPANLSYISSCEPERFEQEYSNDYEIAGRVIIRQSILDEEVEVEVEIFEDDEGTIKHEWIHLKQIEDNRLYDCEDKIMKRINEAEAYAFSQLPNAIFNIFYGKPKI